MRLDRLLAIAERDLRIELTGRSGLALPGIAFGILLPIAFAPPIPERPLEQGVLRVGGDVPPEVLALDRVERDEERAFMRFVAPAPGSGEPFIVSADFIPDGVRDTMDRLYPGVRTELVVRQVYTTPQRSMILALVAASVLTGSLAQSLAGERSQRTLDTLLAAAVTSREIVVGKWLAWASFGALSCLASIGVSLVLGRQSIGWWILPAPIVSLGTAAIGLWLVRKADDVVGGATTTIRVLPAAVTAAGLAAWMLGRTHPLLGAAIPLGGALVGASDIWPGPLPALVASASTLALSAWMLHRTAVDLEPDAASGDDRWLQIAVTTGLAAGAWWLPVVGPLMWAVGGNASLTEDLAVADGALAGALGLWLLVATRATSSTASPLAALGLSRAAAPGWLAAACTAPMLAWWLSGGPEGWTWRDQATRRLHDALAGGVPATTALAACVGQELLLRGWLRGVAGDAVQIALTVVILTPLDPLTGLLLGVTCTLAVRLGGGSVLPAIAARIGHLAITGAA